MNVRSHFALVWCATSLLFSVALAARADDLPKAEAVMDRYVEVTGGKEAYAKVKDRVSRGKFEIKAAGLTGKLVLYQAQGQLLTTVEFEQLGKTSQGVNQGVAWELSPITGPRLLEGDERADTLREANLDTEVAWRKYSKKVELQGVEDVDGKPAYKVLITPTEGSPITNFYDKASGLLVRSDRTLKSPMGEIPVQTYSSDYKKGGGVLMPYKSKQKVLTQEIEVTIEEVKENANLPTDTFKLPAEVQALVDKKKGP